MLCSLTIPISSSSEGPSPSVRAHGIPGEHADLCPLRVSSLRAGSECHSSLHPDVQYDEIVSNQSPLQFTIFIQDEKDSRTNELFTFFAGGASPITKLPSVTSTTREQLRVLGDMVCFFYQVDPSTCGEWLLPRLFHWILTT